MACDCNKKDFSCSGMPVSSNCVIYEGVPIPLFGICTGDPITHTVQAITDKLIELWDEEETELSNITLDNCNIMKEKLGAKDKTYANLIQILIDYQCTLTQLIDAIEDQIDEGSSEQPYAFDLKCITPVGTPVNVNAIVQGLINKVCQLETTVSNLGTNVTEIINEGAGTFLGSAITANGNRGFTKTGSGSTTKINFYALVPPLCPIPYVGPASNFDSDGKGLAGTAFEGWLLLNGRAVQYDARGRVLVAAVKDIQGGSLDPAVDPTQPFNPNTMYALGDKFGENYHKQTINELVPHSHTVSDSGHQHDYTQPKNATNSDDGGIPDSVATQTGKTSIAFTGITLGQTGGGDIFNVRQPSLVITGYIMRID